MAKRHPLMPKVWSSHEFYDLRIGMGDILKRWDGSPSDRRSENPPGRKHPRAMTHSRMMPSTLNGCPMETYKWGRVVYWTPIG